MLRIVSAGSRSIFSFLLSKASIICRTTRMSSASSAFRKSVPRRTAATPRASVLGLSDGLDAGEAAEDDDFRWLPSDVPLLAPLNSAAKSKFPFEPKPKSEL